MAFTDRYIKLPIHIYDRNEMELTGNSTSEPSWIKVNPLDISSYRPTYNDTDAESQTEIVSLSLKNGDEYLIYLSIDDFEKKLNFFTN